MPPERGIFCHVFELIKQELSTATWGTRPYIKKYISFNLFVFLDSAGLRLQVQKAIIQIAASVTGRVSVSTTRGGTHLRRLIKYSLLCSGFICHYSLEIKPVVLETISHVWDGSEPRCRSRRNKRWLLSFTSTRSKVNTLRAVVVFMMKDLMPNQTKLWLLMSRIQPSVPGWLNSELVT